MIKVVASGSSGNSYIYSVGEEILLIELGISFKKIKQKLDYDLRKVVGALVTHEHSDHSKGVLEASKCGIDIYMSSGTSNKLNIDSHRIYTFNHDENYNYSSVKIGNFTVLPFKAQHDCEEPVGFLIYNPNDGKTLFLTDSYYCKYKFTELKHILIECNYSEDVIPTLPSWRARTIKSHASLETLKETLQTWNLEKTKDITLIHISGDNGDSERFQKEIEEITGIKTYVAMPGLEIK